MRNEANNTERAMTATETRISLDQIDGNYAQRGGKNYAERKAAQTTFRAKFNFSAPSNVVVVPVDRHPYAEPLVTVFTEEWPEMELHDGCTTPHGVDSNGALCFVVKG